VLKERGWLKSARVLSAESEILGDGVGFLGVICRTWEMTEAWR
jgi:hypothetical protein